MNRIGKGFLLIFLTVFALITYAQNNIERPKLVVGIVVDQMRWDYLYRFQERFGEDGLMRFLNDGFNCESTMINYLPTFTAPGHASIYTGSVPALHGIVGNNWIDRKTQKYWYCTEDSTVNSVGGGKAGKMSPRNMIASTVGDELRLATNFQSRVYGIAMKDRGAILPAGHAANAAFWQDEESGDFISSDYYLKVLPDWLKKFNSRNLNDSLMNLNWQTLYPIASYTQSSEDNNPYEGAVKGEEFPVFPHQTSLAVERKDKSAIRRTPFGMTLTRMMAQECILGEKLGKGASTDMLTLSFSSPDYIGHQYGPNSIEVEDAYLRLDRELAVFFHFLDEQLGKGNYTVFLTADHGGAHNAQYLIDKKIPAKSVKIKEVNQELNYFLKQRFGQDSIVQSLMNYQVFLNEDLMTSGQLNREEVRKSIMEWLKEQKGVTAVLDLENPGSSTVALLKERSINGFYWKRCGNIQIILDPAWYSGFAATGTTHGSWNPYDARIPLLWYGFGVRKGSTFREVKMSDIAPTLSALLKIQTPNACIGEVIQEVLKPHNPVKDKK